MFIFIRTYFVLQDAEYVMLYGQKDKICVCVIKKKATVDVEHKNYDSVVLPCV